MHECMGFRDISALLRENFVNISLARFRYCSHTTVPRGVLAYSCQNPEIFIFFQWVKKLYNSRYSFSVSSKARTV